MKFALYLSFDWQVPSSWQFGSIVVAKARISETGVTCELKLIALAVINCRTGSLLLGTPTTFPCVKGLFNCRRSAASVFPRVSGLDSAAVIRIWVGSSYLGYSYKSGLSLAFDPATRVSSISRFTERLVPCLSAGVAPLFGASYLFGSRNPLTTGTPSCELLSLPLLHLPWLVLAVFLVGILP